MKAGIDYIGISITFYCNDGNGNFVLHKRSRNCRDEQGRWDFGGGQLHFGEDPKEGVLREVMEEYGCKGEIQEQLPYFSMLREHDGVQTHWIAIPFFIYVNPDKVVINEPESMEQIGWFTLHKLPQPLHTAGQFTITHYKDHFDRYQRGTKSAHEI